MRYKAKVLHCRALAWQCIAGARHKGHTEEERRERERGAPIPILSPSEGERLGRALVSKWGGCAGGPLRGATEAVERNCRSFGGPLPAWSTRTRSRFSRRLVARFSFLGIGRGGSLGAVDRDVCALLDRLPARCPGNRSNAERALPIGVATVDLLTRRSVGRSSPRCFLTRKKERGKKSVHLLLTSFCFCHTLNAPHGESG